MLYVRRMDAKKEFINKQNIRSIMAVKKTTVKKTKDGTVDKRTKEGKAIAARMAKARKEKNSLENRIKRLFK